MRETAGGNRTFEVSLRPTLSWFGKKNIACLGLVRFQVGPCERKSRGFINVTSRFAWILSATDAFGRTVREVLEAPNAVVLDSGPVPQPLSRTHRRAAGANHRDPSAGRDQAVVPTTAAKARSPGGTSGAVPDRSG